MFAAAVSRSASDVPHLSVGVDQCWRCSKVQMYHQLLAGVIQVVAAGKSILNSVYNGRVKSLFGAVRTSAIPHTWNISW